MAAGALAGGLGFAAGPETAAAQSGPEVEIRLDPSRQAQVMTGWESTADMPEHPAQPEWDPYFSRLLDRLVDEVGLNRVRLEIRAGAETRATKTAELFAGKIDYDTWKPYRYEIQNDNDDPLVLDPAGFDFTELDFHVRESVLPLRDRLAARGERLVVNLCYVAFTDGATLHMRPEEYAEFVLATYRHLDETFGFVPDLWEVVLEPDLPRRGWTGAQMGRAVAAAAARLRAAGYTPAFVGPSVTNMANAVRYGREMLAVPGVREVMRELSYHRYRGGPNDLRALGQFAAQNGLPTSMLELWFGRATHDVLFQDITVGGASAFQNRVLGGHYDVHHDPAAPGGWRLSLRDDSRYNRLYFLAARLGAQRVGATASLPGSFAPLAFRNPDGRMAVVVEARAPGMLRIPGLPPGRYRVLRAWATGDDNAGVEVRAGEPLEITVPGPGVIAAVAEPPPGVGPGALHGQPQGPATADPKASQ